MRLHRIIFFAFLLTACGVAPASSSAVTSTPIQIQIPTSTQTLTPVPLPTSTQRIEPTATIATLPTQIGLNPEQWRTWPVIPMVTQHVREIYQLGQTLGNDPHGFSILGDCQSTPDTFLGLYVVDESEYYKLPEELKETVSYFGDSFIRESPTIKTGTTAGALLWWKWHENKYTCIRSETPIECELRLNRPSFAIIMVGTHYEARNDMYMRKILDQLIAQGIVPILSTKADNREGDDSLNLQTAQLALEYDIPMWNFWPVVDDLPNRGLYTKSVDAHLGDIYLTEEALARHRYTALQALDEVWRTATGQLGE